MRVLHDVPIITERLTTVEPVSGTAIMHPSLRDEYERVKLTLEPLTLEDVTKVWTALSLRYRLSAAYVVNVVQIESRRPRTFPRPVGPLVSADRPPLPSEPGPAVEVLTIQTPTITSVGVRRGPGGDEQPFAYARVGDRLVLRGTALAGAITSGGVRGRSRTGRRSRPAIASRPTCRTRRSRTGRRFRRSCSSSREPSPCA